MTPVFLLGKQLESWWRFLRTEAVFEASGGGRIWVKRLQIPCSVEFQVPQGSIFYVSILMSKTSFKIFE